jgi:rod shape-determining protein MreC
MLVSWLHRLAEPAEWVVERGGDFVVDLALGASDLRRVVVDNRHMQLELEGLRARELLLEEDLAAQREAIRLAGEAAQISDGAIAARCAYRDLAAGTMEVRTAGAVVVPRNAPAVTAGGLVGRVVRSEGTRHWLQLITHPAAAAAVQSADADLQGLVLGAGNDALSVAYVPRQAKLERGSVLVTSGGDGIFPPGIPVAKVIRIRETNDPFLEIAAAPTATLQQLRIVMLIPSWSRQVDGEPLQ